MHRFYIIILCLCFFACTAKDKHNKVNRAFYHWKTNFAPTTVEKKRLDSLAVQTLYLKYFDVIWDEQNHKPAPAAKIIIKDTFWLTGKNIVPTVFITNETLKNTDSSAITVLANHISSLIQKTSALYQIHPKEIQMDCDWTATTKQRYFNLLHLIKRNNKGLLLSATIRLHQLKYQRSSGVPPVDKGLLMCYNMGNLTNINTPNSILDLKEMRNYLAGITYYPLALDVALPLFSWYVHFRNNQYIGLLTDLPNLSLPVAMKSGNRYKILKDTMISERLLKKGDILRYEESDPVAIIKSIHLIRKNIKNINPTLSFYHLDSIILNKYSRDVLENMYRNFY